MDVLGDGGGIDVPYIGIHVGTIGRWSLKRRGEGQGSALFDLHAVLSFVNRAIWEDPEYDKEVVVVLGRNGPRYRIEQSEGFATALNGKNLTMEGVTPCRMQP